MKSLNKFDQPEEQKEEVKVPRIIDKEEDRRRVAKLNRIKGEQERTLIEERESEYFGSQLSNTAGARTSPLSRSRMNSRTEEEPKSPKFKEMDLSSDLSNKKVMKSEKNDKDCIIF